MTAIRRQSLALALAAVATAAASGCGSSGTTYRVPSASMLPTYRVGQRVDVDTGAYDGSDTKRGDVVVFNPPAGADAARCGAQHPPDQACPTATSGKGETRFIKRVVGLPGDHLKLIDNHVYIDGKRQSEPFVNPNTLCDAACNLPREITVPAGELYMLGDNRGESADSREWGPVQKGWIVGKAGG